MSEAGARGWLWAFPCLLLLVGGAVWRWPTLHQANYLQFAGQHLSYSDVIDFHGNSIVQDHRLPYLQVDLAYPVLIGAALWLTGFAPGVEGYFVVNAVLLCGCLFGCFVLLARMRPRALLSRFALAPGLALYGVLNWDALALLGLVAELYCVHSRRWSLAGVCLALGASAKLFPAFTIPVLLAYSLRAPERTDSDLSRGLPGSTLRFLAGLGVTLLALNLPIAVLSVHGWSHWLLDQGQRNANLDSIWAHIPYVPENVSHGLMYALGIGGLLWIAIAVWDAGTWEAGTLLSLLVFLLLTKIYSPQYDLWILPLLAILACPLWLWILFMLADVFYDLAIFHYYGAKAGGLTGTSLAHDLTLVAWSVWGREVVLVLLAVWGLTRLLRGSDTDSMPAAVFHGAAASSSRPCCAVLESPSAENW